MEESYQGPYSFEYVLDIICKEMRDTIIRMLEDMDVPDPDELLRRIIAGEEVPAEKLNEAWDIIHEAVKNEAECIDSISGMVLGSSDVTDAFFINIMNYGPVYYVRAPEFDDSGFFLTEQAAWEHAQNDFEPFITAYKDLNQDEPDEDV